MEEEAGMIRQSSRGRDEDRRVTEQGSVWITGILFCVTLL